MPSWKKLIQSGSDAHLSQITASNGISANSASFGRISASMTFSDIDEISTEIAPSRDDVLMFNGTSFVAVPEGTTFELSLDSFIVDGEGNSTQLIGASGIQWPSASSITYTAEYSNGPPTEAAVTISGDSTTFFTDITSNGNTGTGTESNPITYPSNTHNSITFKMRVDGGGTSTPVKEITTGTVRFRNLFMWGGTTSTADASQDRFDELESQNKILPTSTAGSNEILHDIDTDDLSATEYLAVAHRQNDGQLSQIRCGSGVNELSVCMNPSNATSLSANTTATYLNTAGKSETFRYYRSILQNLGDHSSTFVTKTTSTRKNYIYWGYDGQSTGYDAAFFCNGTPGATDGTSWDYYQRNSSIDVSNFPNAQPTLTLTGFFNKYVIIAIPTRHGILGTDYDFKDPNNIDFAMNAPTTVAITNPCGFKENYYVYRSAQNLSYSDGITITIKP